MLVPVRSQLLSFALAVVLAVSVGAECPVGDLNNDCQVNSLDLLALTDQWLDPPGGPADLIVGDGVNLADFAALAGNWHLIGNRVVINEIHYDPDVKTELVEFVEIFNPGTMDVDVSGWYFSNGIFYKFPSGSILPAGGYFIVAMNPAQVQGKFGVASNLVFGPWQGRLDNDGETIVLRDADGITVDQVDYQLGFPWPTVGDHPGYSIELTNPMLDNDLGGSWRASEPEFVTPPIILIPSKAQWRYFKGDREASTPTSAWRQINFDDSMWSQGNLIIGYGENFVQTNLSDMRNGYSSVYLRKIFNVDDPASIGNLSLEAIYDDGFNAYINGVFVRGANVSSSEMPYNGTARSALEDHDWKTFNLPAPSGYLVAGKNVLTIHLYNSSIGGSSDCFLDVRLKETQASSSSGPTPGQQNTSSSINIPPHMRQVKHRPSQPQSGEDVKITIKVTDPNGVDSVVLSYQLVDPGNYIELNDTQYQTNWTMLQMNDDGVDGDEKAGNDVYTAVLPGSLQINRRLIRYRISVQDSTGLFLTGPYLDDTQPNFAYFVYDGVPAWQGSARPGYPVVTYGTDVMNSLPVYHLISKNDSVRHCQWLDRYGGDLYKWWGTLVYDGQVYDHIRYRARGGVWRYAMGKNMWKFDFNRGHSFEARDDYGKKYDTSWDKLNFSACIQQGDYRHRGEQGMFEAVGFKLFNMVGVESPKTNYVQFRVIDGVDEFGPTQFDGDFWGLYLILEQMDGRFLDEHDLPDGNLYKMEGGSGDLNNQGPTAAANKSDLNTFINGYQSYPPSTWWLSNADVDKYFSYRTIVDGIHHYDIGSNKNYFYYLCPEPNPNGDYLWSQLPWDLDLTWADNMYDCGNSGRSPFKRYGLCDKSDLRIERNNRIREIRDLLFNTDQGWQLIDDFAAIIDNPDGWPSMVDADRAMWDYNPIMVSSYVNSSKAGQGRFYQQASTKDFPGMVKIMKDYIVRRSTVGDPGRGEQALDQMAYDSQIPYTPGVTAACPETFPINALSFETNAFNDPQGSSTFGALKWRIAEITDRNNPNYDPDKSKKYEINPTWESGEIVDFNNVVFIPASVARVGRTYRVRCRMKDNTGRWSHWSYPVQFIAGEPVSAHVLDNLRITEVMYNPTNPPDGDPNNNDEFEFVELQNIGDETIDLTYASFVDGVTFDFNDSDVTSLEPGDFALVVRNKTAFESRYGTSLSGKIAGEYAGKLSNNGEIVSLVDFWNGIIAKFEYNDGRGWPLPADGGGHSLVPLHSALPGEPDGSLNYGGNWRASTYIGGSPGLDDPELANTVVLNEIMAHTDYSNPQHPEHDSNDWIELYNTTPGTINLHNWYLSDDIDELKKWAIPAVDIAGKSHISFDEVTGFHHPISSGFGLNKAGEEVILSYLPGTTEDRVVDYVRFKGQENAISLGRHPDGDTYWLAMTPSRDSANISPVLDLIIDELMYHPADLYDEYIELHNPTANTVFLENAQGSWRLDGGVDFTFGPGTSIAAAGSLIVVGFDPVAESSRVVTFMAMYDTGLLIPGTDIVGPWAGSLSNASERIALERPQAPDQIGDSVSWVIVNEVIYSDSVPWPQAPDGTGEALQKLYTDQYHSGNDPANWQAAPPTPGSSP